MAWVVEMVTRKRRAPILEHSFEATLGNLGSREVFGYIGQTESAQGRVKHLGGSIKD
jgi:hypothetical protein